MSHAERLAKLKTLILQVSADEVRVLLAVAERLSANRPPHGQMDAQLPRDHDGDVSATLQQAVDLSICAATALVRARERRP